MTSACSFSALDSERQLPAEDVPLRFATAFSHGTMKLELYAPRIDDRQSAHDQDELYIILSGTGRFTKNGYSCGFKAHDVIFVEAGADHHFSDFTNDFVAWVILWGPNGGEAHKGAQGRRLTRGTRGD